MATDLGVVKAPNKDGIVEVAVPDEKDDNSREAEYAEIVKFMKAEPAKVKKVVNASESVQSPNHSMSMLMYAVEFKLHHTQHSEQSEKICLILNLLF